MSTLESETNKVDVLKLTDEAFEKVIEIRSGEDEPESMALRVEITGHQGVDFTYDLSFLEVGEADKTDLVSEFNGLPLVIPEETIERLTGSTLDLPSNSVQGGLVIRNPNRPDLTAEMDFELTGSIPEKLQQLLDQQINPSLAAHGGFVQIEKVDDTVAYLTMGGGCQGCSMSAETLREGITVMVGQAIPEISEVIDVTDHESGENPFFT